MASIFSSWLSRIFLVLSVISDKLDSMTPIWLFSDFWFCVKISPSVSSLAIRSKILKNNLFIFHLTFMKSSTHFSSLKFSLNTTTTTRKFANRANTANFILTPDRLNALCLQIYQMSYFFQLKKIGIPP